MRIRQQPRRLRDRDRLRLALSAAGVWRHHPFFTNSGEPTVEADLTHRRHAIIETVFADLIDGPLAHLPSGRFSANRVWALCAAITHNLLRAAGTLTSPTHALARGATLRHQIVTVPHAWPDPDDATRCTYPRTGQGPSIGSRSALPEREVGSESQTCTLPIALCPGQARGEGRVQLPAPSPDQLIVRSAGHMVDHAARSPVHTDTALPCSLFWIPNPLSIFATSWHPTKKRLQSTGRQSPT
jgi:hypothetical protein